MISSNDKEEIPVVREVKNNVFTDLYSDPKYAAELLNALQGRNYKADEIQIATLKNVLTFGIHNDVAFCALDEIHSLIEHQSTYSKNMPVRMLEYYSEILKRWLKEKGLDKRMLHTTRQIMIPRPCFYVLYNGRQTAPKEAVLDLSSSYVSKTEHPDLELKVHFINLGTKASEELLEKCESLKGYTILIEECRNGVKEGMSNAEAVAHAIDVCIRSGLLQEYLQKRSAEVSGMLLEEWNYEDQVKAWKEEGREEAREEAMKEGLKEGREAGLKEGRAEGLKEGHAEGLKEGHAEGLKEGRLNILFDLVNWGKLTAEEAAEAFGVSSQEFLTLKNGKK